MRKRKNQTSFFRTSESGSASIGSGMEKHCRGWGSGYGVGERSEATECSAPILTWLGRRDSNPQYQSQSLVCYRYTTSHRIEKGLGLLPIPFIMGWVKGLEPSTPGTTIRCSNQLSYTHHIKQWHAKRDSNPRPTA